jgi:hypothetical protein
MEKEIPKNGNTPTSTALRGNRCQNEKAQSHTAASCATKVAIIINAIFVSLYFEK